MIADDEEDQRECLFELPPATRSAVSLAITGNITTIVIWDREVQQLAHGEVVVKLRYEGLIGS